MTPHKHRKVLKETWGDQAATACIVVHLIFKKTNKLRDVNGNRTCQILISHEYIYTLAHTIFFNGSIGKIKGFYNYCVQI